MAVDRYRLGNMETKVDGIEAKIDELREDMAAVKTVLAQKF
ncbi:MAG: hypothetical protein ACI3YB_04325 [Prevotella sp.]|mgnify:CR=1 FL=1